MTEDYNKKYKDSMKANIKLSAMIHNSNLEIDSLNSDKEVLEGQVSVLTSEKGALEGKVSTLTSEKGALADQVSTLTSEKGALEGQVSVLTSDKGALEGQVSVLTSDKGALEVKVSVLISDKKDLENKLLHSFSVDDVQNCHVQKALCQERVACSQEEKSIKDLCVAGKKVIWGAACSPQENICKFLLSGDDSYLDVVSE